MKRYVRILILIIISLLVFMVVHYLHVRLARISNDPSIKWTILFVNSLIVFLYGAIIQVLLSFSFQITRWFDIEKPLLCMLALILFVTNFLTSIYHAEIIIGFGMSNHWINSLMDDENKVLLNMLAGCLMANSLRGNSQKNS